MGSMARWVRLKRGWVFGGLAGAALLLMLVLGLPPRGRTIEAPPVVPYGVGEEQFRRSLSALAGPGLVGGNQVDVLRNGDGTFPAMLAAIASAAHTITFESSYFRQDTMAARFADAFVERVRAGVKAHVVVDWFGTDKAGREQLDRMAAAGVEVEIYHKPRPWQPQRTANRTHRRVLVVDGRVGFTGGICVADTWMGDGQDRDHWRDLHFRLAGPVVAQLQAAFMDNWRDARGVVLHGEHYFPRLDSAGTLPVQVTWSAPDEGSENLRLVYLMAIGAARSSIMVQNPYFVPDDGMIEALRRARARGVAVSVMLPADSVTDAFVTQHSSRSRWRPLLEAGVRIWLYQPTLLHQKVMIVDSALVTAGSANFDNRSFRLNDEVNFTVPDTGFARRLAAEFMQDLSRAEEYTLADWERRPWHTRLREWFAGKFRFLL